MAGASALHQSGVRFLPGMSASIHAVFCLIFLIILGLCLGYVPALAYGSCRVSDQGTTLRASDLHNARATILNPFSSDLTSHFEAETKWQPFCRWNFQIHFFLMKIVVFRFKFNWSLFLRVLLTIGSDNGLMLVRRQAIIWTNDCIVYWSIYVSLGLDELKMGH